MRHTSLALERFKFTAVSYEWGPAESSRIIIVNGCSMMIRENLWQFLTHLLRSDLASVDGYQSLWADAICINQDNTIERNQQVSMMGMLYRYTKMVYVWLGPTDQYLDTIVELQSRICQACIGEV